MEFGYDEV